MSEVPETPQPTDAGATLAPTAEVKGPLVFSCAKCRTLIGDSYSFLTSSEESRTITLASSSNIQRSADVYTSKSGGDIGSTYFNFTCLNCQTPLGRYYLTTSKDLDEQREKFTFSVDAITSYELGKAQHGKMPVQEGEEEEVKEEGEGAGGHGGAGPAGTTLSAVEHMQELQALKASLASLGDSVGGLNGELLKVQQVLFGVLGRIEGLEQGAGQVRLHPACLCVVSCLMRFVLHADHFPLLSSLFSPLTSSCHRTGRGALP